MNRFFRRPRPKPPASPEQPAFGLVTLLELFDGDGTAIASLLAAAISSISSDLETLECAASACDSRAILAAAHRLKGTSGSIGARRLIDICTQIEQIIITNARLAPATLHALRDAVACVQTEIVAFAAAVR